LTANRDVLWTDLLQFDPPSADKVWDGDLHDPDAPGWYADLGSLIHRAQGPAELDELVDEPEVVATMRRASLGAAIVALPRHRGVRSVGRLVVMKTAAAATTVSMVGVAAAATTGIVATVAATVVVPAIQEKVRPAIEHHIVPVQPTNPSPTTTPPRAPGGSECRPQADVCTDLSAPVVVYVPGTTPAAPVPATTEPAPGPAGSTTTVPAPSGPSPTVADTPLADEPAAPAPAAPTSEPALVEPTSGPGPGPVKPTDHKPAEPEPVESPPSDPGTDAQVEPSAEEAPTPGAEKPARGNGPADHGRPGHGGGHGPERSAAGTHAD
jgi:hypothetical protein